MKEIQMAEKLYEYRETCKKLWGFGWKKEVEFHTNIIKEVMKEHGIDNEIEAAIKLVEDCENMNDSGVFAMKCFAAAVELIDPSKDVILKTKENILKDVTKRTLNINEGSPLHDAVMTAMELYAHQQVMRGISDLKKEIISKLTEFYSYGDKHGYSNTELSRIRSCIKKVEEI